MHHKFGHVIQATMMANALEEAVRQEALGNWWVAAELFHRMGRTSGGELKSRLLTRAAGCFEAASSFRESALTYVEAATAANQANSDTQVIGELDLLAAHGFRQISDPISCAHYL